MALEITNSTQQSLKFFRLASEIIICFFIAMMSLIATRLNCHVFCGRYIVFLPCKAPVNKFLAFLQSTSLNLPDREISILAVACVDLCLNYQIDTKTEAVVVQTDASRSQ